MKAAGMKVSLLAGTELQSMPSSEAAQAGDGTSLLLRSQCNATPSASLR